MQKPVLPRGKALHQTIFYTALFSLLAHSYRFLNMSFSGDSAQISQAEEVTYQISIGRFFQPVLWKIRGTITAPVTIWLFATAALIGAAILIVALLGIKRQLPILLTCGILATNETLAVSYASYLPWVDVYMIALLLAVAGVYVSCRWKHGWLASPILYFISLGLYQSYSQVAVVLIILLLILRLLQGERTAAIWLDGVKACVSLLVALALYYLGVQHIPSLLGITLFDDYNSARNATIIFIDQIPQLLYETYIYPFQFFLRGADESFVPPVLTLALLAVSLPALLIPARKLPLSGKLTLLFLLAVLPLGANYTAFISKGIVHPLMVYAFFFLYLLCITLLERMHDTPDLKPLLGRYARFGKKACAALVCVMLGLNILTANQLYLRRDLEFYSTTSAATRILKHADSVEGYVPGETPVCVIGYLPSSKIGFVRPGFEELSNLQGMLSTYAAAYETATPWYYQMILGYPVNFVSTDDQYYYRHSGITDDMPSYPDEGCYQIIDGILFIKL